MNKRPPRYPKRPHSTGRARIVIDGKTLYLGMFGTPESYAKYREAIINRFGRNALKPELRRKRESAVTVARLIHEHSRWAEQRYLKNNVPTGEANNFRLSLRPVLADYAETNVNSFGPRSLLACRSELARSGLCRDEVNKRMRRIRRVFRWGVSRELVRPETFVALATVEGLRKGELVDGLAVPESPHIKPVSLDRVNALEGHVLPQVWAMIQVQLLTAMRPGEVCVMRTCDIQRESVLLPEELRGRCWVYVPESHKTEHHGRKRVILLPLAAQEVLRPWLRPDTPEAYLFNPAEAVQIQSKQRAEGARWAGKNKKRAVDPQRRPGSRYTTMSYTHAIHRGCESAFNMPAHLRRIKTTIKTLDNKLSRRRRKQLRADAAAWRAQNCSQANQLRHTAATRIREKCGVELARVILGHSQLSTTEIYAERDYGAAAKALVGQGFNEPAPPDPRNTPHDVDQAIAGSVVFYCKDGRIDAAKMQEMSAWSGRICILLNGEA